MASHSEDTLSPTASGPSDSSTKQQAVETAEAGKQAASKVAATAADAAKDVAAQTSEQARDLLGKSRDQVRDQVETQQVAIVENLRSLGDQLAEMTEHVEHQGTAVDVAAQARDRVRGAADWLDGRDPGDVLDELRKLGRNKPGAFLLGAAAAGVLAGRLTRGVVQVHTDDAPNDGGAASTDRVDAMGTRPRPALGGVNGVGSDSYRPAHETGGTVAR